RRRRATRPGPDVHRAAGHARWGRDGADDFHAGSRRARARGCAVVRAVRGDRLGRRSGAAVKRTDQDLHELSHGFADRFPPPLLRELAVLRGGRFRALARLLALLSETLLEGREVALEESDAAFAVEGEHVRRNAVQEVAVVGDHDRAPGEALQGLLEDAQRL